MNPEPLRPVADHLWQSTLFAGVAGLLTLALRTNRARIRHWLWLTASCKFLIPLSILIALGGQLASRTATPRTQSSLSVVMEQVSRPFAGPAISMRHSPPPAAIPVAAVLLAIWACGFLGIGCVWWIRWRRIRAEVRAASSVQIAAPIPVRSSSAPLEPGVFGIFRPVLLLPARIFEGLAPAQLEAVIAHELCHVRHRDNLIAAVHMFVETVFWFHPLVWWIGKRMVEERERACDEEVLLPGRDPRVYAEGILNICKLCVESPLACVSGVTGSNLRKRIEAILSNRVTVRLTGTKKVALAFAGIAALAVPVSMGVLNAPAVQAQSSPISRPKFEVVSVKPCKPGDMPAGRGGRSGGGGTGNGPGQLRLECRTLENLIRTAYIRFADGKDWTPLSRPVSPRVVNQPIAGEPAWATSERYTIDAKPESAQTDSMMRGPMLQTVLEDRFQLKFHRDLREVPVYALVVGKGGPKLQASKKDSCTEIDFTSDLPPAPRPDQPPLCGPFRRDKNGGTETFGQTLTGLCMQFSVAVDRDVVDRTGLAGKFDIHLDLSFDELFPFARRDSAGDPAAAAAPSDPLTAIIAAVQKLGLKLEPAKATGEFLVIDHVERPSEN
jgi:bla regulator protein blaR1